MRSKSSSQFPPRSSRSHSDAAAKRLRVAVLPIYSENPYQQLLRSALEQVDVESFAIRRTLFLPALWRLKPDVIHFHWLDVFCNRGGSRLKSLVAFCLFWIQWPVLRLSGIRIVWTLHNLQSHERRLGGLERVLIRKVGTAANRVIVHCRFAAERLLAEHPQIAPEKIATIPHGNFIGVYPNDIDKVEARARLGLPTQARVLLFLGHVRRYKGVTELIEQFRCDSELEPIQLVIAGQVAEAALAEELRRVGRDAGNISLHLAMVPAEDISLYMAAADAVATPFRDVLTSGSLILALSYAKPVIAPKAGCLTELTEDVAGYFYDPSDPQGLSDALRRFAVEESDLTQMGMQNRAFAESLSWDMVARLTRAAYLAEP